LFVFVWFVFLAGLFKSNSILVDLPLGS